MNVNMQKAQKDLTKLEKKYQGKDDRDSMMAKSQEMMLIYKKYDINPFSSCLFAFLQLPIFFAFFDTKALLIRIHWTALQVIDF